MNRITKGGFGKTVAAVLLVAMVFSGVPALGVSAQENDETVATVQGEQQDTVDNQQETENTEASQEGTEEETQEPVQDVPEEGTESTDSIQQPAEVTEPQSEENSEQAGKLNYLYLGSDYIEAPGTQNIMVSWGTREENVSAMRLVYANAQNEETVLDAEKQEDNTWLFSKEFSESETGVYTLLRLETEADGMVENYIFEDAGMNVLFGVNEGVNEEEVSEHIDMDSFETEEEQETNVETSVVALSEEGEEAVDSITSALGEAEQQTENSASASLRSRAVTFSTRSSDLVIVLDPGHDSSHTGASGNGVREEVATLKIAQYCREELEQYAGVTVYMTRESAACPYPETIGASSGNILDIKKRVQKAAEQGADAFISIHLNSSTSSSANGAQVFYPEASFAGSSVANEGAALANKIQQELLALGLNRRANDDADYAVNTESAKYGFPGLIIEHAFVSNASDANNYLNSDDKLKRLGVADATGIANYYGLSKDNYVNVPEGTYEISTAVNTDKVITSASAAIQNGIGLSISGNAGDTLQRFELISLGNGYYKIASETNGKVLDVADASTNIRTEVQLFEWNGSDAQKWRFSDAGDGYYYIRSAVGTYLNLQDGNAADGNGIWMWTNDKTAACKWKLTASEYEPGELPVPEGTYTISTSLDGDMVLEVNGGSISNRANVQISSNNNTAQQRFELTYVGNCYYKITSEKSGKSLDVDDASIESGANVQQFDWNGTSAQLWKFIKLDDGTYYIKSKLGNVLDVWDAGTADGTNVDVFSMNGTKAQKWNLEQTDVQNVEDGTYVIRAQDRAFSVLNVDGSNVEISSFDNINNQKFEVEYEANGYYRIYLAGSEKKLALDVADASSKPGANLQVFSANGSDAQLWKFIDNGSGGYYLKSKCGTYVDVRNTNFTDGNNVQMYSLLGGSAQKWVLDEEWAVMDETPVEDGVYYIHSSLANNKVLDIADASLKERANVQIFTQNGTAAQRFEITHVRDGYYKIISEVSGMALDVADGSSKSGANIWQYSWNGSDAQLWRFIDAGNGNYYIKSKLGTVIDLDNANTANGTNIDAFTINGTGAQRWKLEQADGQTVADGTYVIQSVSNQFQVLTSASKGMQISLFDNVERQRYQVTYQGGGYYRIDNVATQKTLTVKNGSTANKTALTESAWTEGNNAQLWKLINAGNGQYYIRSKCGTYIDIANGTVVSGNSVWMFEGNGTNAQKWKLNSSWAEMEERPVENGTYTIASSLNASKVIDVADGSFADRANIQIFTANNTAAQRFEITYAGDGYYKIISEQSGRALDVDNASSKSGTNIQQFGWNGTTAQLWKFLDAGNGKYYIKSKLGTVIDLDNAATADRTNIQAFSVNGTNAQKWALVPCESKAVQDGTYVISNASFNYMVLTANNKNIQLNGFDNVETQKFQITHVSDGYYKIVDSNTGQALEVANGSSAEKANLQLGKWDESDKQLWKFVRLSSSTYMIRSKLGTVIDVDNGELTENRNVQLFTANGTAAQKWVLQSGWAAYDEGQIVENGTYYIKSVLGNNQVLDVDDASTKNGANVQIFSMNKTSAQRFEVLYVGDGYYRITAEHSDKVLEVANGSTASGANVQQNSWSGTDRQLWKFVPDGKGNYYIKSKLGNTLDVDDGKAQSRTNVQVFSMNGTAAQKWSLSDSDFQPISNSGYVMFTKQNVQLVMDVDNASAEDGARIQLYTSNETDAQLFQVDYQGKGYYRIVSKSSGKVLDVKDGSGKAGAKLQQMTWNGSDGQLWKFISCNDGTYYIKSKLGTVIEVAGTVTSGADLQMNVINGSSVQKWGMYDPTSLYAIMGNGFTNVTQMANYYRSRNSSYPYTDSDAPTIEAFCQMYIEECQAEGVKAEVAFCQAMLETGFLKFGGDVKPEQYNFAGLGATGGGNPGESFSSVRIGIRAQVQHIKAYASTESLNQDCVDNRFKYVTRGCAPYVEWLGQQENPNKLGWATGKNYGYNILNNINNLKSY